MEGLVGPIDVVAQEGLHVQAPGVLRHLAGQEVSQWCPYLPQCSSLDSSSDLQLEPSSENFQHARHKHRLHSSEKGEVKGNHLAEDAREVAVGREPGAGRARERPRVGAQDVAPHAQHLPVLGHL